MSGTGRAIPQVVIVAGGAGSRVREQIGPTAKLLAPVHGRPFLAFLLELLANQGTTRVHLCLGQYADQVLLALPAATPVGIAVTVSAESDPLGTAGCLRAVAPSLEEEFLLLLGDTYTPVDLADLTRRYRGCGTEAGMAVLENHDWLVPSNVEVRQSQITRYDKNATPGELRHVDYGIALLRRDSLLRLPPRQQLDLAVLFHSLIADGQLAALEVGHRFYEIGSPQGYTEFCELVSADALPRVPVSLNRGALKFPLGSRPVYSSPWMRVREDMVRHADGSLAPFGVVTRQDWVLVLCELPDERLVMVEQYRYAAGRWSLEFPQGGVEPGESFESAALRELREETGLLGTDPTVLAEGLHEAGDWATQSFSVVRVWAGGRRRQILESGELGMRVRCIRRDQILRHVRSGLLHDAATLAAFTLHAGSMQSASQGVQL
jgi:ADP-ribose pyrophosphatase YjhB (NUDIX family)/choline kinase